MTEQGGAETAQTQGTAATASGQGGTQSANDELAQLRQEIKTLKDELEKRETRISELNSESAGRRVENKTLLTTLEEIKAALEAEKKQREQAEQQAAATAKKAERDKLVAELAAKYKLPPKVAERLAGETPEDMDADAKALAEELAGARGRGASAASAGNSAWEGGLTREALSKMSTDEINRRWDEVAKLLESGQ